MLVEISTQVEQNWFNRPETQIIKRSHVCLHQVSRDLRNIDWHARYALHKSVTEFWLKLYRIGVYGVQEEQNHFNRPETKIIQRSHVCWHQVSRDLRNIDWHVRCAPRKSLTLRDTFRMISMICAFQNCSESGPRDSLPIQSKFISERSPTTVRKLIFF